MTHMPIDLFFSYISIPGAIAVALVLWGAWKLTEPEDKSRPKSREISSRPNGREISALDVVAQPKG